MAKREFIEKGEVLKNWHTVFNDANGVFEDVIYKDDIENHTITEQEIVKPYLEKLKADINEMDLNRIASEYEDRFFGFQSEVLQMIENLLSESED